MYKLYRNRVNRERKRLASRHLSNKMSELKASDSGGWWKAIKEITGQSKKKNNLQPIADTVCDGDMQAFCDLINNAFVSVSETLEPLEAKDPSVIPCPPLPDQYVISLESIEKLLSSLNCAKAMGPDGIPNWILKEHYKVLSGPVCSIINSSFRDSYVPNLWKSADVCPLPKVTNPTNVAKDFRPISLTPVLSKIAERFARDLLLENISDSLDSRQFGSVKGSSTVHALVEMYHHWVTGVDVPGNIVRILLLDFRKAFDLVDHKLLLQKISNSEPPQFLSDWITSFLTNRQQRVKIGDVASSWKSINGGVPQGTLLGPICFLLHINDLSLSCETFKYVDDSSVSEVCKGDASNSKIQHAANEASEWANTNLMKLNCDKTKELLVDFRKNTTHVPNVIMSGTPIERVSCSKLLGVMISADLSWDNHIDYICGKGAQRLYFIRVLKRAGSDEHDLIAVYVSTIRSVLEYACEVWHPGLTHDQSRRVESIQKRALKIIYPLVSYSDSLTASGLSTLAARRDTLCRKFFTAMLRPEHKLHHLIPDIRENIHDLRAANQFPLPSLRTSRARRSLVNYGLFNYQC